MKILVFLFCLCFYIYCCCYSIFRHSSYSFAAVMTLKIRGVLSFLSHVHSRRKHERFFILNNMRCFRFFGGVCLFVIFFSFMYKILLYEDAFNTNFCKNSHIQTIFLHLLHDCYFWCDYLAAFGINGVHKDRIN